MKIRYGEKLTRYVELEIDDIDVLDSIQLGESLNDNPVIREQIMKYIELHGWRHELVHEVFVHRVTD